MTFTLLSVHSKLNIFQITTFAEFPFVSFLLFISNIISTRQMKFRSSRVSNFLHVLFHLIVRMIYCAMKDRKYFILFNFIRTYIRPIKKKKDTRSRTFQFEKLSHKFRIWFGTINFWKKKKKGIKSKIQSEKSRIDSSELCRVSRATESWNKSGSRPGLCVFPRFIEQTGTWNDRKRRKDCNFTYRVRTCAHTCDARRKLTTKVFLL